MFKKFLQVLLESSKNKFGTMSSMRVSSYLLISIIILFAFTAIGIELAAAIIALNVTGKYIISNEFIIIMGFLFSHHLSILGINKYSENTQHKATKMSESMNKTQTSEQQKVDENKPNE